MKKILNWLDQEMEFEGDFSYAIASHKITNFPGEYIYPEFDSKKMEIRTCNLVISTKLGA